MSCFPNLIASLLTIGSKFLKLLCWAVPVTPPAGVHVCVVSSLWVWAGPVIRFELMECWKGDEMYMITGQDYIRVWYLSS